MEIAAGEYGYTPYYFRKMLEAGAVDVLQADATRCGGFTGFLRAAALCDAFEHPALLPLRPRYASWPGLRGAAAAHMEWFHDHVRIESMLFDGAPQLKNGTVAPDLSQPGHGLTLRAADARKYEA